MSNDQTMTRMLIDAKEGDHVAALAALDLMREEDHEAEAEEATRFGAIQAAMHAARRLAGRRDVGSRMQDAERECSVEDTFCLGQMASLLRTGDDCAAMLWAAFGYRAYGIAHEDDALEIDVPERANWATCIAAFEGLGVLCHETEERLAEAGGAFASLREDLGHDWNLPCLDVIAQLLDNLGLGDE